MASTKDGENKGCAIAWKIKNFSCYEKEEALESPVFYAENVYNTNWILRIFPLGTTDSCDLAVFLKRVRDEGPPSVKINLKICLLSNKGLTMRNKCVLNTEFYKGTEKGFQKLLERAELFGERKNEYLPEDTLTAHCQFWEVDTTTAVTKHVFVRTQIEVNRKVFLGTVYDFISLRVGDSREILLQTLSSEGDPSLFIPNQAYLSVTETTAFNENLKITIVFDHFDERFFFSKINIHSPEGQTLYSGKLKFRYEYAGPRTLDCMLLETIDGMYLPFDTLTFHCELIVATGVVSQLMKYTLLPAEDLNFDAECSASSAMDDFTTIYNDGFLCDVDLQTGAESFPAHKVVLSARSPVFKAMFANNMKETVTNRVDLPDLDGGTVRRLLLYMYSDAVECREWDSVRNLYAAADKYAIEFLKTKCSTILRGILVPSQACELLVLADMHRDNDLKKFAQDFMSEHDEYILGSDSWMELEQRNPQLAIEAMRHLYTCLKRSCSQVE
ncbi:TD and POZ domain-containing protein 3 [Caerostris extrusa]|uniref:TD and POZ domain-containing protein 3 n=1 Tax=Caerostris extrusa TaxID=172846 RepID=A0AAV4MTF4_CAEEX|nr:TD and POZ domain-containing protein 3 [Caerostris extrusa]